MPLRSDAGDGGGAAAPLPPAGVVAATTTTGHAAPTGAVRAIALSRYAA